MSNKLKKQTLIIGGMIFIILLLDQLLKYYIKTTFQLGEVKPILGNWFVLEYVENQGMAFGTTFGGKAWHKLALSIFRLVAVSAMIYYWFKSAKKGVHFGFLLALGAVIAGASGNLLDSMYMDFAFPYDPCHPFNLSQGSGKWIDCDFWGRMETKPTGFLLGNVVDMFKFDAYWPKSFPLIGGNAVFPAIWNLADFSISAGLIAILIWNKKFFPKVKESQTNKDESQ